MAETAKQTLTTFLRRLTNLSGNNRSLFLPRLPVDGFIDLQELSYLKGYAAFDILASLLQGNEPKICALHDSRLESNNKASYKLKLLQRLDHFVFEERGTNDLHIGWPFVRGKFNDGTDVRCPLLYIPVSLAQKAQHWVLELRADAGITLNKTFLLAYAYYNNVKVEEELLDFSFDDFDKDITRFRTQLYELLNNRIELNFNTDNFSDELKPFTQFRRKEFSEVHRTGELKLFPEAALGMFPQAGSQLVPDYLHLLGLDQPIEFDDLFGGTVAEEGELVVKEERLFTPFPIDAFQENAIHLVKKGKSIVVQGPPGTGKSQLICNLLADAMATGKRALLVCQKRAALDVVYERMHSQELSAFVGLVHDFRNDRREIFAKIARQIDRIDEYKTRNRSVDIIQMERKFLQVCRMIDQITEELGEFREALYNDTECGLPVKHLYLTSNPDQPHIPLKQEYPQFRFPADDFIRKLKRYAKYAEILEDPAHPWKDRKPFSNLSASDQHIIIEVIDDVLAFQKNISTKLFRITGTELNLEECEDLWYRHEEVLGMLSLLKDGATYRYFQRMCREPEEETNLLWLSNMERVVLNCFDEIGPEITIPTDKLGKFQEALHERMKSRGNLIRKIRWELFSENKFVVKRALVANDLAYNKYGLRVLEQRIDSRLNLEHYLTSLKNKSWLLDLPSGYRKDELQAWFNTQKLAIRAKLIFKSVRQLKDSVNPEVLEKPAFHSLMRNALDILRDIPQKKEEWLQTLSPFHLRKIILEDGYAEQLKQALRKDFDNLCEFDTLRFQMQGIEENVIMKLHDHLGTWNSDELAALFDNSIRLAWIDHIEIKYPLLRSVSSMKMGELQKELQELVSEKEKLSLDILLLRTREHAYEGLQYNRLNNLVTYRDLMHQVTKKKKLWPLRKVISTYRDELFRLVPCWMASPESVSALFPMEKLFDLVIFDEASQCFSEHGIPSMYRGKQILVAGDGQQLRPSELYQIRFSDEESESADMEVESLLDLSDRYLPTVHLQAHYRSKSLELIDFSNRNFYDSRLRLLPDREKLNSDEPAIEYVKVDGQWENQINIVEAEAVALRVMDILGKNADKEIGIVTFNAPQRNAVLDVLEDISSEKGIPIPSSLFVKNIENVQGDEKDIIIFSVGYAPDKKGKLALQFGSLNVSGGENRLNVAVTRAREKIIIITSITADQLDTSQVKNRGPKLLRDYLHFAREVHEGRYGVRPDTRDPAESSDLAAHLLHWGSNRLNDFAFERRTLPYTDVSVLRSERYLGALLTDDERFRTSMSIKDAFAYTPALLRSKNWNYKFVFSRQYWKDFEELERSLMLFVGNQSG